MKATETALLPFLKKSPQFIVPIYQRTYSWTEKHCRRLWLDILNSGRSDKVISHFIGSIVYIEHSHFQVTSQSPLLIIDGQQRLTTVSLIIEALARLFEDRGPIDDFSAKKLRHYYLLNDLEEGRNRYKLLLTDTDRETLLAIVDQRPLPPDTSQALKANFDFFHTQIRRLGDDLQAFCKGLRKLSVVDISLNREYDNPQLIFESMNSTGLELSQADLIRNFVLMNLEPTHQTRIYKYHWRPMELAFGQTYSRLFDSFMRHYLTLKTGNVPKIREVYEAFKSYAQSKGDGGQVESLVQDLRTFADYYCKIAMGSAPDAGVDAALRDLRELAVDVAYPFLLELYDDYDGGRLSANDMISIIRLVGS